MTLPEVLFEVLLLAAGREIEANEVAAGQRSIRDTVAVPSVEFGTDERERCLGVKGCYDFLTKISATLDVTKSLDRLCCRTASAGGVVISTVTSTSAFISLPSLTSAGP